MVVCVEEELEVPTQLFVAAVVVAAHGGVLQRAVHAFGLTVGQGVLGPSQPVLDTVFLARVAKGVDASGARLLADDPGCLCALATASSGP